LTIAPNTVESSIGLSINSRKQLGLNRGVLTEVQWNQMIKRKADDMSREPNVAVITVHSCWPKSSLQS